MKRKLLSVLFTLGMIVCLCGALALTSYAATTEVADEAALTTAITNAAEGDIIKLTANIDLKATVTIPSGKTVTLDLNGKVLNGSTITDANNKSVITNNGTLTITETPNSTYHYFTYSKYSNSVWVLADTTYHSKHPIPGANDIWNLYGYSFKHEYVKVQGGVIIGGTGTNIDGDTYGGGIYNNGTLIVESANIIGNTATYGGGIALNADGKNLTFKDGYIAGNYATNSGGGVYIDNGSVFTMEDAYSIIGNSSSRGGGVFVRGSLIMNGGRISVNYAVSGAGVYVYYNDSVPEKTAGKFIMNYGKIEDNVASTKGGGVYVDKYSDVLIKGTIQFNSSGNLWGGGICCDSPITVGGDVLIRYNTSMSMENNVFIRKDDGKSGKIYTDALSTNAKIGVTIGNEYANADIGIFPTNCTKDDMKHFIPDFNGCYFKYNDDGSVELAPAIEATNTAESPETLLFCDFDEAIYFASQYSTEDNPGKIKILADIDLIKTITVNFGQNIILDLNDHILNGKNIYTIQIKYNSDKIPKPYTRDVYYAPIIVNRDTLSIVDNAANKTTRYFTTEYCLHGIKIGEECDDCPCIHGKARGYYDNFGCEECDAKYGTWVGTAQGFGHSSTYYTEYNTTGKTEGKDYIKVKGGALTNSYDNITNYYLLTFENVNVVGNFGGIVNIGTTEENAAEETWPTVAFRNSSMYGNFSYYCSGIMSFDPRAYNGGGLYAAKAKIIIENSRIQYNNMFSVGGGVANFGGKTIIGGNTVISDNILCDEISGDLLLGYNNIEEYNNNIELGDGNNGCCAPADGMKIGVFMMTGSGNYEKCSFLYGIPEEYAKYFFSSSELYKVVFVKGDSEAQDELLKLNHLELVDRITVITKETKGVVPDNVSAELAIEIAKTADVSKDKTYGCIIYARAAGGMYKYIYHDGTEWKEAETPNTFKELKKPGFVGVIGVEGKGCERESDLYACGKLTLVIGGKVFGDNIGISNYYNDWLIRDYSKGTNGQFIGLDKTTKQLKYTDTYDDSGDYQWKYDGTGLYIETEVTVKTRILFFYRKTTTKERFYLTVDGVNKTPEKGVKVITKYDDHNYSVESKDRINHTWTCSQCGDTYDEEHTFKDNVCLCGAKEKAEGMFRGIEVSVETKVVSRKLADIIKGKNKAYTVKITPYGDEGVYATEIKYTLDGGETWSEGDSFVTYNSEFEIDVQVTDNFGKTKTFTYSNKKKK